MEHFDFGVGLAFALMIISTIISVIYGAINWNKDSYVKPPKFVKQWKKTDKQIEDKL